MMVLVSEMELSLGNQLPEISQAMEAAGLGRSGAGQLQMLQASNAAREQAAKVLGLYARDNHQKTDPLAALIQQLGRTSPPIVARDPDHK